MLGDGAEVLLEHGLGEKTDEGQVLQAASVRPSPHGDPDPGVRQQTWLPLWLRVLENSPSGKIFKSWD